MDQYADALNYKNPYTRYIYELTSGLYLGSLSLNNLNFNPSLTKTHLGYLMDKIEDEKSYIYSQNEKITMSPNGTNIVVGFYFWMQNVMIYNERSYKKFQDILSKIGGIGSFVLLVALAINSLVANFIILLDTEELVLNIDKVNYYKNEIFQRPSIYRKANEILHPPKINNYTNKTKYYKNQQQNSLFPILIKTKNHNDNNNSPKSEPLKYIFLYNKEKKINKNKNNENKYNSILPIYNKNNIESQKVNHSYKLESYNENLINVQRLTNKIIFYESKDTKRNKNEIKKHSFKKNNFTWFNYFFYLLLFKRYNPKIKFYEDFRAQLISEENLLQNYSDIYKLLKACNIERHNYYEINS